MNEYQRNNGMKHTVLLAVLRFGIRWCCGLFHPTLSDFWEGVLGFFKSPCLACYPDVQIARVFSKCEIQIHRDSLVSFK